jgi:23S rRNA-/tRNA-specific pseudouridylate synthase
VNADAPFIVHRDDHLLVLFKPAWLPTTHPRGGDCLVERAKVLDPDAPRLHATSRLDAEVTGLVTFARTKRANALLREAREAKRYHRLYLALTAAGALDTPARWEEPIAIDPADRRRRVVGEGDGAQRALTMAAPRARSGPLALLELRPQTGRTHQLRVHAAAHGLPLFGDVHYGGHKRAVMPNGRVLTARRTMLHCAALDLPAIDGAPLALRCDPPADFGRLWRGAGGNEGPLQPK